MAVTSINIARVSNNLRAFNLLEALRSNQLAMYHIQTSLATGYRFSQPSQDPVGAASALDLTQRLDWMGTVKSNLDKVNAVMNETDSAMMEAVDLVTQAHTLVVQAVDDSSSGDERSALVPQVQSLLDQLTSVGNRKYLNTYLFAGQSASSPFELTGPGVLYKGDATSMQALVDTNQAQGAFTTPGEDFFAAVSSEVQGTVDLDPAVTAQTRVSDLRGALGRGVQLGRIQIVLRGSTPTIDLRAATVGDLVGQLNAGLPAGLQASLGPRGIVLTQSNPGNGPLTIAEIGGGCAAADLGLVGTFAGPMLLGGDLDPRLTPLTRLADLKGGSGIDLSSGLTIQNGAQTANVNFTGCTTVEDMLNKFNSAGVSVWARVGDDGRTLDIRSRLSGTDPTIGENGGRTASVLGVRSFTGSTRLADLNDGRGVQTAPGADVRIATADGRSADIDLDGATSVQNVLDRLNAAAGGAFTAGLAARGNGIVITDLTSGTGSLRVSALNSSLALHDLGLDGLVAGNQLVGRDVNPQRTDGPFTALIELRDGLVGDNRALLQTAGARLDRVLQKMQVVQGETASQARVLADRQTRIESDTTGAQIQLSNVRDVDIADAAVRFQQLQTALQANMSTSARVMNLSLLDYLR